MRENTSHTGGLAHKQTPSSEQYLGHKLLIELLAHQFAFPVQWIDTQKELLGGNKDVQRIIEIGPGKVLAPMAKKMADKLVGDKDQAQSLAREFLFIGNDEDARKIRFQYDSLPEPPAPEVISNPAPPVENLAPAVKVAVSPAPAPIARQEVEVVADVDVTPTDIILALVAQKLKRGIDRVSVNDSIRTLSAGKSVLQNEIIGDLSAEFGDLPSGSEELPIGDFGSRLASSGFSGKPGKAMKKLLERLFSQKMPAGFGQSEAEALMQARWGLGPKRQVTVLCLAVTMEPPTRLADSAQAEQFLASAVTKYGAHTGIMLPERVTSATGADPSHASSQVDSASFDALKKDQTAYLRKQFEILAKHLNIDLDPRIADLHAEELLELRKKLTGLQVELDDDFMVGIQGVFDPKKQRRYTSWWNWAREDIIRLLQSPGEGVDASTPFSSIISTDRLNSIVNRWNPAVETILQSYSQSGTELAKKIANGLLDYHRTFSKKEDWSASPAFRYSLPAMAPHSFVDEKGQLHYIEKPRPQTDYFSVVSAQQPPHVHLRSRVNGVWQWDSKLSQIYLTSLSKGLKSGLNFSNKTALVTGAGPGSIGSHLVRSLVAGGARVIVTTNRTPSSAAPFFAQIYKESGAPGSELIVLPFNAASQQDCQDLVTYIYDKSKGLGTDLDLVIPFAAIPENGRELDQIDARSELAHRAMLVNLLRLLGCIKQAKEQGGTLGRPATVILPLSPNHGDFGGDGLYSESKLGLETLFNRFHSESWSSYISVVGAVIGWTRGTGLMNGNDVVAQGVEDLGVLTFTAQEMALNILTLFSPKVRSLANQGPIYADISGGLLGFEHLKESISSIRADITMKRSVNQAISEERARHLEVLSSDADLSGSLIPQVDWKRPRSNIRQDMPALLSHAQMTQGLSNLNGMVDLSYTVVIVGFSELGPWGSSRTRWQMESQGQLNQNGFTEMAWIMGLIKHSNGLVIDGKPYFGWVDKKTGQAVHDADIAARYGEHIMNHAGIRTVETTPSYDPVKKELLQEIVLDDDLPSFEASESVAKSFQLRHGEKVTISPTSSKPDSPWLVSLKKGATFHIPKTVPFHQSVAGQLPHGWDPTTYGIPEDIIAQVDPVTLYTLCAVSEAAYSAGIEDVFELYKYMHVAELGNYIGSGAGGMQVMQAMYRNRYKDLPVQSDILQETFLNSIAAWVNMLLLGSAGPIKTPVGACATAVESLDTACEAIKSGSVKAAFVGGVDDWGEEVSYEFDSMKATAHAGEEKAKGMLPSEMSRPTSTSRAGFTEAAGSGVQLIMSAELALQMGLPIRGIIAYTQMSADGISRSLPAPGHGVLTATREGKDGAKSPLVDLEYRRAQVGAEIAQINAWRTSQHSQQEGKGKDASSISVIDATATRRIQDIQRMWNGNLRFLDPNISPIRAALAAWGLTVNDVAVASFHGTSTKANDTNESQLINDQMRHLGRKVGHPLLVVAQKYLTGHPKAAAAAWQLNGIMQIMETGLVPGNRNADDIDIKLKEFEHLIYPSETIDVGSAGAGVIKAAMLTSFGFGQKGGIVIAVNPRLVFAAVREGKYIEYREKVERRRRRIDGVYQLALMDNKVVKMKERSVWLERGREDKEVFLEAGVLA